MRSDSACVVCNDFRARIRALIDTPTTTENNLALHKATSEFTDHLDWHQETRRDVALS